ncbi:MAG: HPP family protein [Thermodesulfobacteriota bacterium]
MSYWSKMKGSSQSPPRAGRAEMLWSWLGGFLGIAAVAGLNDCFFKGTDLSLIIGSLGASAVLIFGANKSPLAQPRNVFGGNVLSALIGVAAYKLFPGQIWLASSVAVATAILVMHLTKTLHPPGGSTALIAVLGGDGIHAMGYLYAVIPAGLGSIILLATGLLFNNLLRSRRYPEFWV